MTAPKLPKASGLRTSWRTLILISANLANGEHRVVGELLEEARMKRVPAVKIYEIILQSYLFLGYPKAIEGLRLLKQFFPRFQPPNAEDINAASTRMWQQRGEILCEQTYGSNYERLRKRMRAISPDLDRWMVWEGYGKVLSRSGVPSVLRELCTCAALAVTGDIVQLHSHYRGALNAGASANTVQEMIELIDGIPSPKRYRQATKLLDSILRKAGEGA